MGTELGGAIAKTNSRLDALTTHVVEVEIRLGTAITALAGDLTDVKTWLLDRRDLPVRVDRCEQDIADIKQHLATK